MWKRRLPSSSPVDDYDTFGGYIFGKPALYPLADGSQFELGGWPHIKVIEVKKSTDSEVDRLWKFCQKEEAEEANTSPLLFRIVSKRAGQTVRKFLCKRTCSQVRTSPIRKADCSVPGACRISTPQPVAVGFQSTLIIIDKATVS